MGITAGFMVPHPPLIVQEIGRGEEKNSENNRRIQGSGKAGRRI